MTQHWNARDQTPSPQVPKHAGQKTLLFELEFTNPYFEFKDRLKSDTGPNFGPDYTTVALYASDSLGEDDAASGML